MERQCTEKLTGLRQPVLYKSNILLLPVLLLYAKVMSSDFIEDFCKAEMFSVHLDMISFFCEVVNMQVYAFMSINVLLLHPWLSNIFAEDQPLSWDVEVVYHLCG